LSAQVISYSKIGCMLDGFVLSRSTVIRSVWCRQRIYGQGNPPSQRIRFKLCLTMYSYKVMHDQAPVYLSELCERVEGRTRASTRGDLTVKRTRTKFGERAFIVAGPATWNWLPMLHPWTLSRKLWKHSYLLLANFRSNRPTVFYHFIFLIAIYMHCFSMVFIARQHTDADARYWYSNSVRPSVRDTLVLYENGLTYRHSFFHHTVAQSF